MADRSRSPRGQNAELRTPLHRAVRILANKINELDRQIPENLYQTLVDQHKSIRDQIEEIINLQTILGQHAQAINNAHAAIVQLQQQAPPGAGGPLLQNIIPFHGTAHTLGGAQRRKRSKRIRRSRRSRRTRKCLNKA